MLKHNTNIINTINFNNSDVILCPRKMQLPEQSLNLFSDYSKIASIVS